MFVFGCDAAAFCQPCSARLVGDVFLGSKPARPIMVTGMLIFIAALAMTDIPVICETIKGVSHCTIAEETLDRLIKHNDEVTEKLRKLEDDIRRVIPSPKYPLWTET